MAQFMTQAGLCISIAPVHIIGRSFGTTNPANLSWFAAAYSLSFGTFILVAGRLGDVYGHRRMFVIGFCWFGLWSLLAGFSVWSTQMFFDCCRALQGIGPAILLPNAIAILGRTYPPGLRKEMIFSLFGATAPEGFIVGGVFSSIFAQLVWWPWAYWVMGIVCAMLALIGRVVVLCPLLPRAVFTGDLAWVLGCIAAGWSSFGIIIYYFYQFMEVVKGDSALLATTKWSAAAISGAIAALITGFLLGRLPPSVIMFCAMAFFTAGLSIFATVPVDQAYWAQAFVVSIVTSWGMDMSFPSGTLILSNPMHRHHQGLAATLVATTVNYSISLGLGFAGIVETNVNDTGHKILRGYRGALYLGIELAGLGLLVSTRFMFTSWRRYRRDRKG
ncbi:hypothetical protein N7467_010271 [Penicillium canescens]|nr:hypothetical protein N7467_010271 [Penicillium canescens]